jgi:2-polyprenyl-3-methyl-5-hydroxy-6-metoxy-1,4-benzoquinol methylase
MIKMKTINCRICGCKTGKTFVDLGHTPLSNSYLKKNMIKNEKKFPLHALICTKCMLVQLEEFENPKKIFSEYAYFSSYSKTGLKHAEEYVNKMIKKFNLNSDNLVMEIASNDGYLLQYFKKYKIPVLGIEPAKNVAKVAQKKKIPTITKFFGTKLAKEIVKSGKQPDLLLGNNVLAHVPKLNDFVEGLKILLKHEGIITLEFPHILQLINKKQFDTIYHEHFSYFSLITLKRLFEMHELKIFDVEELNTHGGSLRIFVKHKDNNFQKEKKSVKKILEKEKISGLKKISTYTNFSQEVNSIRKELLNFLYKAKKDKKTVVGYGAPAKGNTLLNFCGINFELIDYTVDISPHKQKMYLPGSHILIKNPNEIFKTKPDYVLILPWNLKEEIMTQMKDICIWGGKFVIPIPEVKIYQ